MGFNAVGVLGKIIIDFSLCALGAPDPAGDAFVIERSLLAQILPIFRVAGTQDTVTVGFTEGFASHMQAGEQIMGKQKRKRDTHNILHLKPLSFDCDLDSGIASKALLLIANIVFFIAGKASQVS